MAQTFKKFLLIAVALIAGVVYMSSEAMASQSDKVVSRVERTLTKARLSMDSDKYYHAYKMLRSADADIMMIQKIDAGNTRLPVIIRNFTSLRLMIEWKLEMPIPTVANYSSLFHGLLQSPNQGKHRFSKPAKKAPQQSLGPNTGKFSKPAKKAPQQSLGPNTGKFSKPVKVQKLPSDSIKTLKQFDIFYANMKKQPSPDKLNNLKSLLAQARKQAARSGISTHSDLTRAEKKLKNAEAMLSKNKKSRGMGKIGH